VRLLGPTQTSLPRAQHIHTHVHAPALAQQRLRSPPWEKNENEADMQGVRLQQRRGWDTVVADPPRVRWNRRSTMAATRRLVLWEGACIHPPPPNKHPPTHPHTLKTY
jgi:hypothetical protein